MAFTSVTTQRTVEWNSVEITQVLSGGVGTGDVIFTRNLALGSAHVVVTSGTDPGAASFTIKVANDGLLGVQAIPILKNPVTLGAALALTAAAPNLIDLMTGNVTAGAIGVGSGSAQTPYKYLQFTIGGAADATTVVTLSIILIGNRQ